MSIVISDFASEYGDCFWLDAVCAGGGFQFARSDEVLGVRQAVRDDGGFKSKEKKQS